MSNRPLSQPARLFASYAQEDEALYQQLEKHLILLQQEGLLTSWHRRKLPLGATYQQEINDQLDQADIILLLISKDFLASDACNHETQRALQRHQARQAQVIPIIAHPYDWQTAPFGTLKFSRVMVALFQAGSIPMKP